MATLIRYAPHSLRREQYDKVNEILQSQGDGDPPQELKMHVLFGEEGDLRVSEIWESEDAWRGFWDVLKSALDQAGVEMGEPQILEVHELWGSAVAAS
jgi:hypothetical protein